MTWEAIVSNIAVLCSSITLYLDCGATNSWEHMNVKLGWCHSTPVHNIFDLPAEIQIDVADD